MPSQTAGADRDMRYSFSAAPTAAGTAGRSRRHGRYSRAAHDPRLAGEANASFIAAQSHSNSAYGGVTSNDLVSEARKYIGTNPTGRGSLWCGAFMDLVLKRTGHPGGGNLAWGYAHYGTRVSGPQVGAIAVMGRTAAAMSAWSAASMPTAIRSSCRAITITRWRNRFIRADASRLTCCPAADSSTPHRDRETAGLMRRPFRLSHRR